jgi:hypothetical protein
MANEFNINESALDAVLAEVTGEIAEMLRKDEAALMKAAEEKSPEDDAPAEASEGSSGPSEGPPSEESAGPPAEAAPPMAPEGSAPPEAAPPGQEAMGAPEEGAIEPAPTVEQLQAEYSQLDPEALKMHYLACKAAIMSQMGGGPEASAPAAAPPAPPAPPAAAPGLEASAAPALKGELSAGKQIDNNGEANGGKLKGGSMKKSETDAEIESLKAQLAAQGEQLKKGEAAMLQLAEFVAKPLRKSVKGLSDLQFIPKDADAEKKGAAASLSKAEVMVKLREKARSDAKLTKSDRDLINQYAVGAVDLSKIEHLLADAAK